MNGRVLRKDISVRVEHIHPSKCCDELKRRVKDNEATKKTTREGGEKKVHLTVISITVTLITVTNIAVTFTPVSVLAVTSIAVISQLHI